MTGTLPTVALVFNPRVGGFAHILQTMWAHQAEFPENLAVSAASPTPTGFYCQKLWGFFFLAKILDYVVWPGAGMAHSQGISPNFYPPHMNIGYPMPVLPLPPPLLAILSLLVFLPRLHISVPPTCLDECGFFKCLIVGFPYSLIFWPFWVLLVLEFNCNSFCGCMTRPSVSTYTSILTGSLKNKMLSSGVAAGPYLGSLTSNRFKHKNILAHTLFNVLTQNFINLYNLVSWGPVST